MQIKNQNVIRLIALIVTIIIFLILIGITIFSLTRDNGLFVKVDSNKKSESVKDITFEPYSNENGITILVTATDTENRISKLEYYKENKKIELNCNGRETIALDYNVQNNGNYKFSYIDMLGNKFEKELVIDDEYVNNLIKIDVTSEKELDTKANIKIDYGNVKEATQTYRIGEDSENWNEYMGEFSITSYEILEKSLQNNDNKTFNLYAKSEDTVSNKVIIGKKVINLDLDMPSQPQINILEVDEYALINENGVILNSRTDIVYDSRDDIINYYSLDKGNTWQEYDGEIVSNKQKYIYAKSVKKQSGLEIISTKQINPSASNAIGTNSYDNDEDTYFGTRERSYILIDESIVGRDLNIGITVTTLGNYPATISLINANDETIYSKRTTTGTHVITILEGTTKLEFIPYNAWGDLDKLREITLDDRPIINDIDEFVNCPILNNNGIIKNNIEYNEIVSINYYDNCVEKLYKINDGDWKSYDEESIKLQSNDVIYAKGINEIGEETVIASYISEERNNYITEEAFDGDDTTFMAMHTYSGIKYMKIDESVWNKKVRIKWWNWEYSGYYSSITFLDKDNNELDIYTLPAGTTYDEQYDIPENSVLMKYFVRYAGGDWWSPEGFGKLYEIELIK